MLFLIFSKEITGKVWGDGSSSSSSSSGGKGSGGGSDQSAEEARSHLVGSINDGDREKAAAPRGRWAFGIFLAICCGALRTRSFARSGV